MELGLRGKRALITGGSRGVGRAVAIALAREGVNVAIGYERSPVAAQVVSECKALGVSAIALRADLSSPDEAAAIVPRAETELGPLHILINNAGVWPSSNVVDTPVAEWHRTLDLNLTAPFLTSRSFVASALEAKRGGTILNVTSQAAYNGSTSGHAHYAASKAALVNFTVSLARETRGTGITVNAIALGLVETDMVRDALARRRTHYEGRTIIGRIATPEEIADMMVFLVSDRAAYLTASIFDATGGMITR